MRLWIFSDLHLEAQPGIDLPVPDADVAVVAGDVTRPLWQAVKWLADNIAPHMPIVYVPGNHEFYGGSVDGCLRRGMSAAAAVDGVHLLHDSSIVIGDIRFVGATLWTDYGLGAESTPGRQRDLDIAHAMHDAGARLMDHSAIAITDGQPDWWQPEHARAAHMKSRGYIEGMLADGNAERTVVVTHHAPHPSSIDPQFDGSMLNPSFASDLSEVIWDHQPAMWVHGHVHHTCGYLLGGTLFACNPRGYRDENPRFDPGLVLTVPRR